MQSGKALLQLRQHEFRMLPAMALLSSRFGQRTQGDVKSDYAKMCHLCSIAHRQNRLGVSAEVLDWCQAAVSHVHAGRWQWERAAGTCTFRRCSGTGCGGHGPAAAPPAACSAVAVTANVTTAGGAAMHICCIATALAGRRCRCLWRCAAAACKDVDCPVFLPPGRCRLRVPMTFCTCCRPAAAE